MTTPWTPPDALLDRMCRAYFDAASEDCHGSMRAAVEASGMAEVVEALNGLMPFCDPTHELPIWNHADYKAAVDGARAALAKMDAPS